MVLRSRKTRTRTGNFPLAQTEHAGTFLQVEVLRLHRNFTS